MAINPNDYTPLNGGLQDEGFFTRSNPNDKLFDFDEDENNDDDPAGEGGGDNPEGGDPDNPGDDGNGGSDPGSGGAGDPSDDDDDPAGGPDKSKGLTFDDLEQEEDDEGEEDDDVNNPASSKKESSQKRKEPLIKVFQKLIDDEVILPFEDDKELADYSQEDLADLIRSNFDSRKEDMLSEVRDEFYENLPNELQTAMNYVANGGKDLKNLFLQLGQTVEIQNLNPEKDSEEIVRMYLNETNFGDEEFISEQIQEWREAGTLGKRAQRFHPQLVKAEREKNQAAIDKAENDRKDRERLGAEFQDSMIDALMKKDLNGIPLTKELRNSLAEGILTSNHDSKFSKNKTNELFHLIEKYQTTEKNPALIAETLFMLRDPEAYRKALTENAVREKEKETVRKLKASGDKRSGGAGGSDDDNPKPEGRRTRKTVKRSNQGFFKR